MYDILLLLFVNPASVNTCSEPLPVKNSCQWAGVHPVFLDVEFKFCQLISKQERSLDFCPELLQSLCGVV